MEFTEDQISRYSRHILLPEVGGKGQKKIAKAKILLVGAGGLGSPAALYLAAAGVGTIGLIDSDVVDLDESAAADPPPHPISDVQRFCRAKKRSRRSIRTYRCPCMKRRLTAGNALKIFGDYDVIIDGVDNFPAKFLINDACFFAGKPLGPWRHSPLRRPRDDHHSQEIGLLPMRLQDSAAARASWPRARRPA